MDSLDILFCEKAPRVVDYQYHLSDLLGEHEWSLDSENGLIKFTLNTGETLSSPVQFIGTYSEVSNTWQWAWANKSKLDKKSLTAAISIRELGHKMSIEAFTCDEFEMNSLFLSSYTQFDYAYVVSSIVEMPFYRCAYDNGELFVLLEDQSFKPPRGIFYDIALERFNEFVHHTVLLDQIGVFKKYLEFHGIEFKEEDEIITCFDKQIFFDDKGFLKNIS